jgi:hypothetical protein
MAVQPLNYTNRILVMYVTLFFAIKYRKFIFYVQSMGMTKALSALRQRLSGVSLYNNSLKFDLIPGINFLRPQKNKLGSFLKPPRKKYH